MKSAAVRGENGFTLIELLVVLEILFLIVAVPVMFCSNAWYTADGVLRELRAYHPQVVCIVEIKPHTFSFSQIEVQNQGGSKDFYLLDSNILFNYRFYHYRPQ